MFEVAVYLVCSERDDSHCYRIRIPHTRTHTMDIATAQNSPQALSLTEIPACYVLPINALHNHLVRSTPVWASASCLLFDASNYGSGSTYTSPRPSASRTPLARTLGIKDIRSKRKIYDSMIYILVCLQRNPVQHKRGQVCYATEPPNTTSESQYVDHRPPISPQNLPFARDALSSRWRSRGTTRRSTRR